MKTIFITGGSRGIGKAIVEKFIKLGHKVAFTYCSQRDLAVELENKYNQRNELKVKGFQADVSDFDKAKKTILEALELFGEIDILINNAGITCDKPLLKMTSDDWHQVININLNGVFNYCRNIIFHMLKKNNGRIVNISSISGIIGIAGQSNYSAAKAGVIGFSKALAKELAPYKIIVNALALGFIETDMTKNISKDNMETIKQKIPLKRIGLVEEVAELVTYISLQLPDYCTGKVIEMDGGMI